MTKSKKKGTITFSAKQGRAIEKNIPFGLMIGIVFGVIGYIMYDDISYIAYGICGGSIIAIVIGLIVAQPTKKKK